MDKVKNSFTPFGMDAGVASMCAQLFDNGRYARQKAKEVTESRKSIESEHADNDLADEPINNKA